MSLTLGFEDSYPLLTLPRIPDLKIDEKIVISTVESIDSTIIDVGISKSIISSYIIKPTPKLIWSFALSPTVSVNCMDVYQKDASSKLYITGITDRKRYHKLLLISRDLTTGEEDETPTDSTKTTEVVVSSKIQAVRFFNNGQIIVVVLANGNVEMYNNDNGELTKSENSLSSNVSTTTSLSHIEFINDIELQSKLNGELLLLVFRNKQKKSITYRLISLNFEQNFFEINSSTEENQKNALYFTYNSGSLYQLDTSTKEIHRMQITNFKHEQTISVHEILELSKNATISISSPASDRLLLAVEDKMHLINFKYSSLLDTFHANKILMSQVVKVKGDTIRTTKSMLFYLNLKSKDNNIDLNVVNINTGYNILSECLGKAINKQKDEDFKGMVNLFSVNIDVDSKAAAISKELQQVYEALNKFAIEEDVSSWEKVLVPYLKNKTWKSIQKSLEGDQDDVTDRFMEFDVESDRVTDNKFIEKVLQLIITREEHVQDNEEDEVEEDVIEELKFSNVNFIPEFSLVYFLTNPLYPSKYTKGLLKLFNESNQINLLRQSIITCPNLPIEELLVQLLAEEDSDIFQDLVNRLVNEHSINEITKNLKQLLNKTEDLTAFLNKLLNTNYNINNWYFIELLIDVGGLFNWSLEVIEQLNQFIEEKVQVLLENTYNLTLTKQALTITGPIKKKPFSKKKNDIIALDNQQQSQLDSILTISNSGNRKFFSSNLKKLPTYSIEKLVL